MNEHKSASDAFSQHASAFLEAKLEQQKATHKFNNSYKSFELCTKILPPRNVFIRHKFANYSLRFPMCSKSRNTKSLLSDTQCRCSMFIRLYLTREIAAEIFT
jgi:hypothetical protein